MPAKSKAQQRFFALVRSYQDGESKKVSPAIKKVAKSISKKDADDFASTKHKGLPKKVRQEIIEILQEHIQENFYMSQRTNIKWEDASFKWEVATGDGFTWDDVVLIQEVAETIEQAQGDSGSALDKLPEDKKKKLIRLVMRRRGIKLYDEYKEVKEIKTKVDDVKLIINEVKKQVKIVNV